MRGHFKYFLLDGCINKKYFQKDINIQVKTAVQAILLNKDTTENILNRLVKTIQ